MPKILGCHVESARSAADSIKYCQKEETRSAGPWSFGEAPKGSGGDHKTTKREYLLMSKAEIIDNPDISMYQALQIEKFKRAYMPQEEYTPPELRGLWIFGAPGAGKSRWARETYPDAFIKGVNKWWCGYQGEKVVIMEDLDSPCLGHLLKIWTDRYPAFGETKCGNNVALKHDLFIITSNFEIEDLWEEKKMAEPIRRRCKVTNMINTQQITIPLNWTDRG